MKHLTLFGFLLTLFLASPAHADVYPASIRPASCVEAKAADQTSDQGNAATPWWKTKQRDVWLWSVNVTADKGKKLQEVISAAANMAGFNVCYPCGYTTSEESIRVDFDDPDNDGQGEWVVTIVHGSNTVAMQAAPGNLKEESRAELIRTFFSLLIEAMTNIQAAEAAQAPPPRKQ